MLARVTDPLQWRNHEVLVRVTAAGGADIRQFRGPQSHEVKVVGYHPVDLSVVIKGHNGWIQGAAVQQVRPRMRAGETNGFPLASVSSGG